MKYLIVLSFALVGFACASKQKSYCDIVDQEAQTSKKIIEDDQEKED